MKATDLLGRADNWAVEILTALGIDPKETPVSCLTVTYRPHEFMTTVIEIPDLDGVVTGSRSDLALTTEGREDVTKIVVERWEGNDNDAPLSSGPEMENIEHVPAAPEKESPEPSAGD